MSDDQEITLTTTVRDVMVRNPGAEAVFNRHGLTGCGGPRGPIEPIGFFATVHHVDPEVLLKELNELPDGVFAEVPAVPATAEDSDIYRVFVKTAMTIVVTVGCSLGALNLASMALNGMTSSDWEAITQAHGHAQIFGWVGLFIMGITYHVLPRLKATQLRGRSFAVASFWLIVVGIALRFVSQPLAESPSFAGIMVLSALAELGGATLFVYVVAATLKSASASDFWDKYLVAASGWFWVSAAATVALTLYAATHGLSVIPANLDSPYLHMSLMGFVVMMIFAFTLRTIPVFMGLKETNTRAFDVIFWMLNLSIVLTDGSGFADAFAGSSLSWVIGPIGAALEYASILGFVYFLGIFGRAERNVAEEGASRGYEKFIRAGYLWLVIAATMIASFTAYQTATGHPVPHSLVGAYRHALTVGFISMIIFGMSARIIPVFTGVRLHSDLMLLGTFVLVNLGNAIRVLTQPLADLFGGSVFALMGVSGFIEVTGVVLFVVNLWRTIDSPVEEGLPLAQAGVNGAATGSMMVSDVLASRPGALEILARHGFTQLRSAIGRRTLAKAVTLEEACRMKGVSLQDVLAELNEPQVAHRAPSNDRAEQPSSPAPGSISNGRSSASKELVSMALRSCYDPEIAVNIVDLGLVRDIGINGGLVEVSMTLTAPGCPMGSQIVNDVRETLSQLPGVEDVVVNLVFEPPWTPDLMSDQARKQLGMKIA